MRFFKRDGSPVTRFEDRMVGGTQEEPVLQSLRVPVEIAGGNHAIGDTIRLHMGAYAYPSHRNFIVVSPDRAEESL